MSSPARPSGESERPDPRGRDLVVVVSPFAQPAPHLVAAAGHAGALGILDLGLDAAAARAGLADAAAWCSGPFGVRVAEGCPVGPGELPDSVDTVLLAPGAPWSVADARGLGRRVLVEVLSVAEAEAALAAGADGLVGRGNESGGRVGDLTTFTLLQHLLAAGLKRADGSAAPVWAAGGIGPATAAAAVAGGAAGVVLDSQLALVREMELPAEVAAAVRAMDGSETALIEGHRVYVRPDLPVARLIGRDADPVTAATSSAGMSAGMSAGAPKGADEPALDFRDTGGERADDGALPVETANRPEPIGVATRLGARDLREQFLPVGQDGAFAADFADRYVTASGVVRAVREAVVASLATADRLRPLAPGSPFAAAHGLRYPVAQGPMTRVSDRAAFARAVADAGGLPFLALALMSGPETRALLEETAELLGDTPWGVGVLGFAPPEVRAAQLEVVHAIRPPFALIAGGRPTQAAPLEAAGITTFLHVPSPGLLDRFLADGARRFVFEGRECGGHVGPRASFALWEAQISRLLAFGANEGGSGGKGKGEKGIGEKGIREKGEDDFFANLDVLFAGGIHDARSAAMVAAAAAPLAERGARVGVLMGTAYLFTEEAVSSGAILPGFQQAAIGCERTVLLETSPGHATRCVESEYVRAFQQRRRELAEAGVSRKEMWAELESLNLGRLRIASKGVRREGGQLVQVDAETQARDGMFMIGQVAALRSAPTTLAELHAEVTEAASTALADRAAELGVSMTTSPRGGAPAATAAERAAKAGGPEQDDRAARAARSVASVRASADPLDIAIIGMAAVFPGAADDREFWANVVTGVDAITEVPAQRWNPELYYDPESVTKGAGRNTPSKWGGFLPAIPFDALAYGIPPKSLRSIDPAQLLALEVSARALRDAGYENRPFDRSRTSVVFGAESGSDLGSAYGLRSVYRAYHADGMPEELDRQLPVLDEDSFPGVLANVIAGRVANRLDLGGINYTVDAACASSLAALDAACKELVAGTSDMVLCGGVDTHNGIYDFLLFSSVHALSPGGRCRSFDADADGTSLGEGVAVVVLKRLADAQRDGDRIHAVIRAVAGSSDGRALGLTAPRKDGQMLSLERAYARAGISPSEIGLLEAHATGTVVGDRTELATLTEVFTAHGAAPGQTAVGSVKSQIGHTKCAAGLAGLIKVARAVATGVRPPTLHLQTPNPYWDRRTSPFFFNDQARPWPAPPSRRHAGLSAFGFGGTNFHVVLSAYDKAPEPAHGLDVWPAELFVVRGRDRAAAARRLEKLAELVRANEAAGRPYRLRDLARTVCEERGGPVQVAFVVDSLDRLGETVERARAFETDPKAGIFARAENTGAGGAGDGAAGAGRTAFLFPGQGSQRPGMLADLFVAFPRLRPILGLAPDLADIMFPPAAFTREERDAQAAAITDTRVAQPTLGMAGLAVHDVLSWLGIRPDHVAGHSYGELVALCVAGVLDRADLLALSRARAEAILTAAGADPGTMAAVSAPAEQVREVLGLDAGQQAGQGSGQHPGKVVIANHNAPRQTVISGPTAAVEEAVRTLAAAGLSAKRIPVACAFHSPVIADAAGLLAEKLADVPVGTPSVPVWCNTTAAPYPQEPDGIRAALAGQVAAPVRFVEQIEAMYAAGVRTFVEVGPGRVLSQLTSKILAGRPHRVVATDVAGEPGLRRLLLAVAELAAAGVELDPSPLFTGRDTRTASVDALPRRPGWLVDGAFVRTHDGSYLPGGYRPPQPVRVQGAPSPAALPPAATPAAPAPSATVGPVTAAPVTAKQSPPASVPAAAVPVPSVPAVPSAAGGTDGENGTRPRALPGQVNGISPASTSRAGDAPQRNGISQMNGIPSTRADGPAQPAGIHGGAPGSAPGAAPAAERQPGAAVPPAAALPASAVPASPGLAPAAPASAVPAAAPGPVDATVLEFLRSTRDVVAAQRDVMLAYLGLQQGAGARGGAVGGTVGGIGQGAVHGFLGGVVDGVAETVPPTSALPTVQPATPDPAAAGPAVSAPAYQPPVQQPPAYDPAAHQPAAHQQASYQPAAEPAAPEPAAVSPAPSVPHGHIPHQPTGEVSAAAPADPAAAGPAGAVGAAEPPAPAPGLDAAAVLDAVVGVIADQTGYPAEMLDPDLDLEADLSIDSIKRTEILGELAGRLGLADASSGELDESVVEELAAVKTVRGIVDWVVARSASAAAPAPAAASGPAPAAAPVAAPADVPAPAAPSAAPAAAPAPGLDAAAVLDAVVGVIADQTGYPAEMLDPDLDLEADLSIDSIKRTEILGELAGRLGLADASSGELDESVVEELAAVKTVRGIVDWVVARSASAAAPADASPAVTVPAQAAPTAESAPGGGEPVGVPVGVPVSDPVSDEAVATWGLLATPRGSSRGSALPSAPSAAAAARASAAPAATLTAPAPAAPAPGASTLPASAATAPSAPVPVTAADAGSQIPLGRFVVEPVPADPVPTWAQLAGTAAVGELTGARFAVVEGGLGIGLQMSSLLEQAGADVRILTADEPALADQIAAGVGADGLFWLASADDSAGPAGGLPAAFAPLRAAALGGARRILVVTGLGGELARGAAGEAIDPARGAGMAGLVRTIARELPDIAVRLVDVHPKEQPRPLAETLLAEMFSPGGPVVVGYRDGRRVVLRVRPAELAGAPDVPPGLGPSSVVLLTGGARGITARAAVTLARRTGCAIELIGRTPVPVAPEDPATASAADAPALRRALVAAGIRRPAEIEARIARLLAEREVRATLAALEACASSVRYHPVDVRDASAVAAVVADVYARHGRLDGVVHGAGILEDRLLRDKEPDSFERVFRTKVDGGAALLDAVRPDVGFVALFGSVAGVFGNRGQVDYAAANDALDTLAHAAARRFAGRVVSVDWGPWGSDPASAGGAGRGMVSPELAREYARRGIGLIDPEAGVAALLRELAAPPGSPAQVVYMCAGVESFDG